MIETCPICSKNFDVLWPQLWAYKRGKRYLCSWSCIRIFDGKEVYGMKTKKDGTPAKKTGPKPRTIETPEAMKAEAVETPEAILPVIEQPKKITEPVAYDGMVIREVEGLFGRYRRSDISGAVYIDFENADGLDVLSLTVDQWRRFRDEHAKAMMILGVEL